MAPAIPDRWLDYKPIGERIEGTRFIAFKVPLREQIIKDLEPKIQLDGNILLKTIPTMGIIIDLTNTNRYYNPEFFQKQGVQHCKVMIPGHVTPPKPLVNRFKAIVTDFIKCNADNDKLIGIHCTHGVNRTGFLICNYMISEMNVNPMEAIKRFDIARGHKIERANYLMSLHQLLNNQEDSAIHGDSTEQTKKDLYVSNWRTEDRNPCSSLVTKSRNDYSNWRTEDRNREPNPQRAPHPQRTPYPQREPYPQRGPYTQRGPCPDRYFNNDRYNRNQINDTYHQRPMEPNTSLRSYEHDNNQPRLRTDYYCARPTRHRTQHIPRYQSPHRQNQNSPNL